MDYGAALANAFWVAVPTGAVALVSTYLTTGRWTPALLTGASALCAVLLLHPLRAWAEYRAELRRAPRTPYNYGGPTEGQG